MRTIAVLGAGSWGTALAQLLSKGGHRVRLWARNPNLACALRAEHANRVYLPGVRLPDSIEPTSELGEALEGASVVVLVVPSHGLRDVLRQARALVAPGVALVSATKGIENESLRLMSDVIREELPALDPAQLSVLSGPSFALEVVHGMPTAVSLASSDPGVGQEVQKLFASDRFRVYTTEDVVGVQLGGALKNVIAIAAGASDGLGFGHNARAALITRGIAEISRLAVGLGAHPMTLAGLSGMGDLVLTCTGDLSRNRQLGMRMARGQTREEALEDMKMVAEGVKTAKSAYQLAQRHGVDMPITTEVYRALYEAKTAQDALETLAGRPPKHERD